MKGAQRPQHQEGEGARGERVLEEGLKPGGAGVTARGSWETEQAAGGSWCSGNQDNGGAGAGPA